MLRFKSWWNEGGVRGSSRIYMDLDFHIVTGNLQVSVSNSDRVYTMSHVNVAKNGRVAECWDMYIGAALDVLGRKTTLMSANLATTEWLKQHEKLFRGVWEKLAAEIDKYDRKRGRVGLRVPKFARASAAKRGATNLRIIIDDVLLLRDRLAAFRPSVAEEIFSKVSAVI